MTEPLPTTVPLPTSAPEALGDAPAWVSGGLVRTADPVDFRTHREAIHGARSRRALEAVAALLRARAELEVDVQVHTGHRSDPEFHRELSARRAATVRQYLIDQGVAGSRLRMHGMGAGCLDPTRTDRAEELRLQLVIVRAGAEGGRCVEGGATPERTRRRHHRERGDDQGS